MPVPLRAPNVPDRPPEVAHRPADWDRRYVLADGVPVIPRDAETVQVGLESPRSVLVRDAPTGAAEVLRRLDGRASLAGILDALACDPAPWISLFSALIGLDLVVPVRERGTLPPHLLEVRTALAHRHGSELAESVLRRRADAMVVVAGSGEVGAATAELLGASGVGEVHLRAEHRGGRPPSRFIRPDDPAPQLPPALVVLADEHAHDRVMATGLTVDLVPHLAVDTGVTRAVIGPLVLPGRSACLSCLDRIRRDLDPGWPAVAAAGRTATPRPSPLLVAAAAALAVEQALDQIDGVDRPATVDATLEWRSGTQSARRRSWHRHPQCGCRAIAR